jgi:hypothetical protein
VQVRRDSLLLVLNQKEAALRRKILMRSGSSLTAAVRDRAQSIDIWLDESTDSDIDTIAAAMYAANANANANADADANVSNVSAQLAFAAYQVSELSTDIAANSDSDQETPQCFIGDDSGDDSGDDDGLEQRFRACGFDQSAYEIPSDSRMLEHDQDDDGDDDDDDDDVFGFIDDNGTIGDVAGEAFDLVGTFDSASLSIASEADGDDSQLPMQRPRSQHISLSCPKSPTTPAPAPPTTAVNGLSLAVGTSTSTPISPIRTSPTSLLCNTTTATPRAPPSSSFLHRTGTPAGDATTSSSTCEFDEYLGNDQSADKYTKCWNDQFQQIMYDIEHSASQVSCTHTHTHTVREREREMHMNAYLSTY